MNLKEIRLINSSNNSLNLAMAKFCPNLKLLHTVFQHNEVDTLKVILNSCQKLESIKVRCGEYLNVNKLLEVIAKCSPKKFIKNTLITISSIISRRIRTFFYKLGKSYTTKITFYNYYMYK